MKHYFEQIKQELATTQSQVIEGELSNLDGLLKMREVKERAEEVLTMVKTYEDERLNEIANESEKYGNKYCGFEIKSVNGRKTYVMKGIPEYEEAQSKVSEIQDKFKSAFEGVIKGTVQTVTEDGIKYWVDTDGEMHLLPELQIGKSFITVKKAK